MKSETFKQKFIQDSIIFHNNKYDYSLVEYKNNKTKVKIICPIHGLFEQTPTSHLNCSCRQCAVDLLSLTKRKSKEDFISDAVKIHGNKYDYSLVEYKNSVTSIKLICVTHGVFEQKPFNHLKGHGCGKCMPNLGNKDNFIVKGNKIHNNKYDYSLVDYKTSKRKVKIICPTHGIFEQTPDRHLLRGHGCPNCKESKGEREVRQILAEKQLTFIPQYTFDNCKNKLKLPFDFYLPDLNICIEYHGEQHYKPIKFFGGVKKFNQQIKRDKIKRDFCNKNSIRLIVVKYTQRNINRFLSRYRIF